MPATLSSPRWVDRDGWISARKQVNSRLRPAVGSAQHLQQRRTQREVTVLAPTLNQADDHALAVDVAADFVARVEEEITALMNDETHRTIALRDPSRCYPVRTHPVL